MRSIRPPPFKATIWVFIIYTVILKHHFTGKCFGLHEDQIGDSNKMRSFPNFQKLFKVATKPAFMFQILVSAGSVRSFSHLRFPGPTVGKSEANLSACHGQKKGLIHWHAYIYIYIFVRGQKIQVCIYIYKFMFIASILHWFVRIQLGHWWSNHPGYDMILTLYLCIQGPGEPNWTAEPEPTRTVPGKNRKPCTNRNDRGKNPAGEPN